MDEDSDTVTTDPDPDDRLNKLAALFGTDGLPDLDEVEGPLRWPDLPADDASAEWHNLRAWVERLLERFGHLDHHVIPLCWWRHNGHVEALAALRDHERICYADSSPATAAVDWHRAFRDIESRLREWTGVLPCGSTHDPRVRSLRPLDQDEWATFVATDAEQRRQSAIRHAVTGE
jgi:hypothetical protein